MTERTSKDKPRRSLSLKKKKGDAKAGSSTTKTPITNFFSSQPPPNLACPLCGQLVPRFKINDHIDLQCQNFDRGDSTAASGGRNDYSGVQLSPGGNLSKSPETDQKEDTKTKTSPYFKKNNSQQTSRDINSKTVVRTIELGSLSSKLSRKYLKTNAEVSNTSDPMSSAESTSSSQKENVQTLEDNNDCISAETEAPSPVEKQSDQSMVSSKQPPSPAKQTKRKKKATFSVKGSFIRKKAKYEGGSGEASSRLDPEDTNTEGQESDKPFSSEELSEKRDADVKVETADAQSLPYYLRNFRTVLHAVLENEDDRMLFNQEDMSAVQGFQSLSGIFL